MRLVREGLWVSEERLEESRRNYLASRSPLKWLISLFKGKAKETSESKK